jgi:transcriptional regulator with XRE-family HTH domain
LPARQRAIDIGSARGRAILAELAREAELARLEHGLSYASVGRAIGLDRTQISRICHGRSPGLSIVRAAQVLAVLGLELGARAYPGGRPVRDAPQVALLARFRSHLGAKLRWRSEVPVVAIAGSGDRRAWDGAIDGTALKIRVDAETAIRDAQALLRRSHLKQRDSDADRVILVVADTKRNRAAVSAASADFAASFPISSRAALRELRAGRAPAGHAIVFL